MYIAHTIPFEFVALLLPRTKYVTSHVPALGRVNDNKFVGDELDATVIVLVKYVEP